MKTCQRHGPEPHPYCVECWKENNESRYNDMNIDPSNPEYNAALRDTVMDLAPFYDPNHKCGIVREKVFKGCLTELRERHRLTLEKLAKWESGAAKILPFASEAGEIGVPEMFFDSFEELKKENAEAADHVGRAEMAETAMTARVAELEAELRDLLEWDNFPPSFSRRDRALQILGQNEKEHTTPRNEV